MTEDPHEHREMSAWAFFAIVAAGMALVAGMLVWSAVDLDLMIDRVLGPSEGW